MSFWMVFLVPMIPAFALAVGLGNALGSREIVCGAYFVAAIPCLIWFLWTESRRRY